VLWPIFLAITWLLFLVKETVFQTNWLFFPVFLFFWLPCKCFSIGVFFFTRFPAIIFDVLRWQFISPP